MNRIAVTLLLLVGLVSVPLSAQGLKEGRVTGEGRLYKKPYSDAELITTLKADSVVSVIKRKGGWYQVADNNKLNGWMRMNSLRFGEQESDQQAGNIQGLQQTVSLFKTGRSGTSGVTVATGIRGLDAADLKNSKPDRQALGSLSKYGVSQRELQNFALAAKLKSHDVAFIVEEEAR